MAAKLPWIKVYLELPRHKKTRALERIIGEYALDSIIRALCYIADWHPSGCLADIDIDDFEAQIRWKGEKGKSIDAMKNAGFIDLDSCCWHDWDDIQLAHVKKAEKDRKDAKERKRRQREREGNARSITDGSQDVTRDVTRDISVTSLSLSSSDLPEEDRSGSIARAREPTWAELLASPLPSGETVLEAAEALGCKEDSLMKLRDLWEERGQSGASRPMTADALHKAIAKHLSRKATTGEGAERKPTHEPYTQPGPRLVAEPNHRRLRGRGVVGMAEEEARPKTAQELLEQHPELRTRFAAWDGRGDRVTLEVKLTEKFPSYTRKYENDGAASAFAGLLSWLHVDYGQALRSWERDGKPSASGKRERPTAYKPSADPDVFPSLDEIEQMSKVG